MTHNLFKNAIIFIILIGILIYFLYFFNFKNLLNSYQFKEHLVNLYKPNRVFYKEDKIYLIDTQKIIDETNPKIFNNFTDFQKFILELEDAHLTKLPFKKEDILKGNNFIKQLDLELDKSIEKPSFKYYKYSSTCKKRESLCNFDNKLNLKKDNLVKKDSNDIYKYEDTDLYKETGKEYDTVIDKSIKNYKDNIYTKKYKYINNKKLKEYKTNNCNINYFDKEKCKRMKEMEDIDRKKMSGLDLACNKMKIGGDLCKNYNNNRWNDKLLKSFCIKDNKNYNFETCLLGEYFKDNMMEFE